MRIKLFILSFLLIINSMKLLSQNGWEKKNVVIHGKILDFQINSNIRTINFYFRDLLNRDLKNTYVSEIDTLGKFSIKIPIFYSQDFDMRCDFSAKMICSPGDSIGIEINLTKKALHVITGNRVKDNDDFNRFLSGLNNINEQSSYDFAKNKTAIEFLQYILNKENERRINFNNFKKQNHTSNFLNQLLNDYLKYESLSDLLSYKEWHAEQNNLKRDSVNIPKEYFDFLKQYNMDDAFLFTTRHADFLHQYNRYILQTPIDSLNKANSFFKNKDIISGAKILKSMILNGTSGFTKNLFMTKLYLDFLEGKQLKEFETLYDSTCVTDLFFKRVIDIEYKDLQNYMSNKEIGKINLRSINSKIVKGLMDTILLKYSGKVIYIDFWAPWCSPCMAELPNSKELQQYYKNQDVVFLFLANRCKEDAWKATIANKGLTGEHLLLSDDQYNLLAGELGITGIPHYTLIDRKGNLVSKSAPNPSQRDRIKADIDRLLK